LSKTILIIVLLKSILNIYPGVIVLVIPSFLPVINIISKALNKTKNSSTPITLFELPILPPSINFQLFKYNRNNKIKTIINRIICSSAAKHKLDDKTDKPQKQAKTILAMLDWFNDKKGIIKEEATIIAYIAKYNIIIPKSYKKTIEFKIA
jgi:hypothetical protein